MTENQRVIIRISDGHNRIYDYRMELWQSGFKFNKRTHGVSFYEKETDACEKEKWVKFSKENRLKNEIIPLEYTRSADYRKTFFTNNPPVVKEKYRCAYCGWKFIVEDITVDHIFPVHKLSHNESVRKRAKRFGIHNANGKENLCAACRKCNSKKGTKMGLWVIKGFLGRIEFLWKIRISLRIAFVLMLSSYCVYRFIEYVKMLQPVI